jgi:hypothetical protein
MIPSFITNFKMPDWFMNMITGIDNSTVDISRVLMLIAALFFFGYSGYEVWKSNHFDHISFATGITTIIAGGSAGVRLKQSAEPQPPKEK